MTLKNDGPKCSQPVSGSYADAAAATSDRSSAGQANPVGCDAYETYALVVAGMKPNGTMGG